MLIHETSCASHYFDFGNKKQYACNCTPKQKPSIDEFLDRMPSKNYNCLDFVKEVWIGLFGIDVKDKLDLLCAGVYSDKGILKFSAIKGFKKLNKPKSPCFVLMQRTKLSPHVGIYYNGRMLHLLGTGVEYQPLNVAKRYFTKIGFYK
jgi:hypothetical protein